MNLRRKPVSVLVVEDNNADAELVVDGFRETDPDVTVHVAASGDEALRLLRALEEPELPDLIFMDLNLPRVGGLDAIAAIKADLELQVIPVLVLTTSTSEREIRGSYAAGAAAVLNKPMRLADHRMMMRAVASFWLGNVRLPRRGL